jgi:LysR substrate binding domain
VVGRGRTEDPVDVWLREEGIERRIVLVVPSYLQALHAVATTDLVAFVPTRLAHTLADQLSLAVLRPPIDPGTYQEFLVYPVWRQQDPASRWLRDIVIDIGTRLNAARRRSSEPRRGPLLATPSSAPPAECPLMACALPDGMLHDPRDSALRRECGTCVGDHTPVSISRIRHSVTSEPATALLKCHALALGDRLQQGLHLASVFDDRVELPLLSERQGSPSG